MRKSQILTIDAILSFLIITIVTYVLTNSLQGNYSFEDEQLLTVVRDAGLILENTNLDYNSTFSLIQRTICLRINVKSYNTQLEEVNNTDYLMSDCYYITGKKFVSKRTVINDYWNLITVEGWYK